MLGKQSSSAIEFEWYCIFMKQRNIAILLIDVKMNCDLKKSYVLVLKYKVLNVHWSTRDL